MVHSVGRGPAHRRHTEGMLLASQIDKQAVDHTCTGVHPCEEHYNLLPGCWCSVGLEVPKEWNVLKGLCPQISTKVVKGKSQGLFQ